ncbi:MAG TPA: enoyl-CoA hydratase-related protein [Smithellaceae bacterium]|nr:enoyl-CoA hydratase-related protein [Smithellaceae bacterium]HRS88598.1 enoyl-CoA hydratase-related protein [Smithellaceae bacterium]HRV25878.1 enoyl-CoA hydratase-related protein [Smithellaceae bacterium]
MAYSEILFTIEDGIATITLNRPQAMNSWTPQMAREMGAALLATDKDDVVRAVVITGAGKTFCAGADLSGDVAFKLGETQDEETRRDSLAFPAVMPWQIRKPVIAAINGHAIGVGITFAMNCDIRFVAQDAKIQFAFVRRGITPELSSHVIVPRVAGLSRAADLLLTGRMITGDELAQMGLASKALPAAEVLPAALELAREFHKAAPVSVALSKRLLWDNLTTGVAEVDAKEFKIFEWICTQPDALEGIESFLQKRAPQWKMSVRRDFPDLSE